MTTVIDWKASLTLYQMTKFFDWPNLKAFADDKISMSEKVKFVVERV